MHHDKRLVAYSYGLASVSYLLLFIAIWLFLMEKK